MSDSDLKERIRSAVDIVEVVGERVPLRKAGKNFVARCPFHVEKTPSFNVNPERQIYHCFGCGVGGDVFSFLMAYDKVSFPEALRTLAERANIPLADAKSFRRKADTDGNDALYEANTSAREFFVEMLADRRGADARAYLERRGLTAETIQRHGIGFAPDSWDAFLTYARRKGLNPATLLDTGLLVKSEQGKVYDRFRNRITFPIVNLSGRVVGFGARTLDPDGKPKYLNSPESAVYQKSRLLYGLFHARDALRTEGSVLVVEGYMDVLQLVQAGIGNVVATCGTALTKEHGEVLRRYAARIVLVFDGDDAGVHAAVRAGDVLLSAGIEPTVVLLPEGEDPDTYVAAEGADALRALARDGIGYLRFRWQNLSAQHDMTTITGRNTAIGDMLDAIAPVTDEFARSLMAAQIADWAAVDESLVLRSLARRRKARNRRPEPEEPPSAETPAPREKPWRPPRRERDLVAWMFDRPWVCQMVAEMGLDVITDELLREIAAALIGANDGGDVPSAGRILDERPDDLRWIGAVTMLGQRSEEGDIERSVPENVLTLQIEHLRKEIETLRVRMRQAPTDEDQRRLGDELVGRTRELDRLNSARGA